MGATFKGYKVSSWETNTGWDTCLCPIREVLEQVGLAHSFGCADFKVTWLEVSGRTQDLRPSFGFEGRFQVLMRMGSSTVRCFHDCVLHTVGINFFLLRANISSSQCGQLILSGNMLSACYSHACYYSHAAKWSLTRPASFI